MKAEWRAHKTRTLASSVPECDNTRLTHGISRVTKLPLQIQDTALRLTTLSPLLCNRMSFFGGRGGSPASNGILFYYLVRQPPPPRGAMASSFIRFLDHRQRCITVGRNPLDEWSARPRDLYLTRHTSLTIDRHRWYRWDSNPRSQQASGRRPTP